MNQLEKIIIDWLTNPTNANELQSDVAEYQITSHDYGPFCTEVVALLAEATRADTTWALEDVIAEVRITHNYFCVRPKLGTVE